MLERIRFRRYRAFAEWTEIELRPLTLIFGYNNTGKSAAVRLLPAIAESVQARRGPLHLDGHVFRQAPFADVSHRGGVELAFELHWSEADIERARWTLRADNRLGSHWVDSLEVLQRTGQRSALEADLSDYILSSPTSLDGTGVRIPDLSFEGPLPVVDKGSSKRFEPIADSLADLLESWPTSVRWITSHRGEVGRSRRVAPPDPRKVLFDAGDAADVLSTNELTRRGSGLLQAVNAIYGELGRPEPGGEGPPNVPPIHQLAVTAPNDGRFSLRLARGLGTAGPYAPNLCDTGEGMTQVLPVAVALGQIAAGLPDAPRILCIEQPELHLHPRAQQAIADRLVDIARGGRARLLVETHAHHVMLAVQVALAEGRLDPADVLVYWARQDDDGRSHLERVELDALGRDTAGRWPPDVFNDDARLARRLIKARRAAQ